MSHRTRGLRRRTLLAAPWALAGCRPSVPPPFDGGWVGDAPERGHRLREPRPFQPSATRRCAVAVVGAGVAGLAAARALRLAGVDDVHVFDLEDEAGGNARGHVLAGMACPLGAHYLPLPGPPAHEVRDLLQEYGLLRSEAGRLVPEERHLCHSPQERQWQNGHWTEGLLPPAEPGSRRQAQYRLYAQRVADLSRRLPWAIPSARAGWNEGLAALDAQTFAQWLAAEGLDDEGLIAYLDYACRDDYGAGIRTVSAWAGLHYFASRHGFHAPGDEAPGDREAVYTWPEGNAWLTRRMAAPLRERLHTAALVRRVEDTRAGVQIDVEGLADGSAVRWLAQRTVLALPLHVAARVVAQPPAALEAAARQVQHAPWLVANLHVERPLTDKPGAPPAWDNVLYTPGPSTPSLGYVDARHQRLDPTPGPTVLTAYWALGDGDAAAIARQRQELLNLPWRTWAGRVVADLARAHPDLPAKTRRVDLMRYGHAMVVPAPGVRGSPALRALTEGPVGRLHMAHGDLAGYSIFEEAFTLGHLAGANAARRL